MKIILVRKGSFEELPQIMSIALIAANLGHDVTVITSYAEQSTINNFSTLGIKIITLFDKEAQHTTSFLGKFLLWKRFARTCWDIIGKVSDDHLLWVSSADAALSLGEKLYKQKYILHIRELYDKYPLYRIGLRKYAHRAQCVVVPEICRAAIFRSWYNLSRTPVVLPNKPADHPRERNLTISDPYIRTIFKNLNHDKKIVLYQGHVGMGRDIKGVAETVYGMGSPWLMVVMGSADNRYLSELNEICPNMVHIPYVTAPSHLQITSRARIGVISYSWDQLNNVFCAPNRIWEYAGFGLPILCNDLPSLQFSVYTGGAGICVDLSNNIKVRHSLLMLDNLYQQYSESSNKLFDSVDIHEIVKNIINKAS